MAATIDEQEVRTSQSSSSLGTAPPSKCIDNDARSRRYGLFAWTADQHLRLHMTRLFGTDVNITSNRWYSSGPHMADLVFSNLEPKEKEKVEKSDSTALAATSPSGTRRESTDQGRTQITQLFRNMAPRFQVDLGSMSGKVMFGSTNLSHFRFTFGPNRCRLLELPVELRYQIIGEVLQERVEDGRCHNSSFRSMPSVMLTCRQLCAEVRKIWSNIPVYIPMYIPTTASYQQPMREVLTEARNIHQIHSSQPRSLIMGIQVIYPLRFTGVPELNSLMRRYCSVYDVHLNTEFLIGRPVPQFGGPHPLTGVSMVARLSSICTNTRRYTAQNTTWECSTTRYNLVTIFSWLDFAGITHIKELLIFEAKGLVEWSQEPRNRLIVGLPPRACHAIVSLLVAIIAYGPRVPKIKMTGMGPYLKPFKELWNAMPDDLSKWTKLKWPDSCLMSCLCGWPFLNMEMIDTGGALSNYRYVTSHGNRLGLRCNERWWMGMVWEARFKTYEWEFEE